MDKKFSIEELGCQQYVRAFADATLPNAANVTEALRVDHFSRLMAINSPCGNTDHPLQKFVA
jgi:hypothetical protein